MAQTVQRDGQQDAGGHQAVAEQNELEAVIDPAQPSAFLPCPHTCGGSFQCLDDMTVLHGSEYESVASEGLAILAEHGRESHESKRRAFSDCGLCCVQWTGLACSRLDRGEPGQGNDTKT